MNLGQKSDLVVFKSVVFDCSWLMKYPPDLGLKQLITHE